MAGIGFNIQKILEGDTFVDSIRAHFYSALICSGPWIMSIITLFCLSFFTPPNIDLYEVTYFRTVIIYVFAFSLIISGIFNFPLTRYLADRLYLKEQDALIPVFNSSMVFMLVIQTLVGGYFMMRAEGDPVVRFLAVLIYLVISMLWMIMIFLTALKDYEAISYSFVTGSLVAVVSALGLGHLMGLKGYFLGYLIGHFLIVMMLAARIFIEFDSNRMFDTEFFTYMRKSTRLLFIGLTYNLAIWIDKIIFWNSPHAIQIATGFKFAPYYDNAVFFAYMTIIPALSLFLIHIETDFYVQYRKYYGGILTKSSYSSIKEMKARMTRSLRNSFWMLVKYQGLISLFCIVFAPQLTQFLKLQPLQIPIFRVAILGSFLHSLLLVLMIIILYFDFKVLVLWVSALFLLTNGVFAFFASRYEMVYHAFGYLASTFISLCFAFYALDFMVKRLEYFTFSIQPMGAHREEEVA